MHALNQAHLRGFIAEVMKRFAKEPHDDF
jgi:hypothetical protein